jgi:uncharacterized protein (DUF983 family)
MVKRLLVVDPLAGDEARGLSGFSPDADYARYRAMVEGEQVFAGGQNYLSPACFEGQSETTLVAVLRACEVCSEATGQKRKAEWCN